MDNFPKTIILTALAVAVVCNIWSEYKGLQKGRYLSKPFLMPLLALFYLHAAHRSNLLILGALVLSFGGDFFLLWSRKQAMFLAGLVSFLLAHLLYIGAFLQATSYLRLVPPWFYLLALPFLLYGFLLFRSLYHYLNSFRIPAFLYMIVILAMSYSSLTRLWGTRGSSFWLPFTGSLLFIASDTLLAFNQFRTKLKQGGAAVMLTYFSAQLFIVCGYI